ncbi:hypothetical protein NOR_04872 [Metarhizium rileyi]|uniref:Uncharacterized protein n=1 Tax=Metarhizium rileyi (strain RCEF 4871) TaxID=1649241 RepID=A0A167DR04_METRR|nr:hypothetical protein NOR_04872 [Metarhizium rileyi RCEF 4871]
MDKVKEAVDKATSSSDSVCFPPLQPLQVTMKKKKKKKKKTSGSGSMTAENADKTNQHQEKKFTTQPIQHGVDPQMAPHQAHPGPAMAKEMPSVEGSKADRQARKEELNK